MDDDSIRSFREKLDNEYQWPSEYTFKFIVPQNKAEEIKVLFEEKYMSEKSSSKGNYISITVKQVLASSDDVINTYIRVHKIEGVIAL